MIMRGMMPGTFVLKHYRGTRSRGYTCFPAKTFSQRRAQAHGIERLTSKREAVQVYISRIWKIERSRGLYLTQSICQPVTCHLSCAVPQSGLKFFKVYLAIIEIISQTLTGHLSAPSYSSTFYDSFYRHISKQGLMQESSARAIFRALSQTQFHQTPHLQRHPKWLRGRRQNEGPKFDDEVHHVPRMYLRKGGAEGIDL